jgi:hypothetical protein
MTPAALARSADNAQSMWAAMPLNELRQARGLSQKMLPDVLNLQQPAIAKMQKTGSNRYPPHSANSPSSPSSICLETCSPNCPPPSVISRA